MILEVGAETWESLSITNGQMKTVNSLYNICKVHHAGRQMSECHDSRPPPCRSFQATQATMTAQLVCQGTKHTSMTLAALKCPYNRHNSLPHASTHATS